MGTALKDQGKLEEAIASYNKALSLKPDYAEAYHNMGVTLQDQGKLEEAISILQQSAVTKARLCRGPQQHGECAPRSR